MPISARAPPILANSTAILRRYPPPAGLGIGPSQALGFAHHSGVHLRQGFTALAFSDRLALALASHYRRYFTDIGDLVSYGYQVVEQFRGAAGYVNRILNGEKPANLPVQVPTKYELGINARTGKALSLAIPLTLLARADHVID